MAWAYSTTTANGTAAISGTTLTFSATPTGTVAIGMVVTGTGITANTNIISGSGLVWTVSTSQTVSLTAITCTTKILTATGGSFASPNKLLAGIAVVQAADPLAGYTFADAGWLQNVAIVGTTTWVSYDEDSSIEFLGSTYLKLTTNSGIIHDYKSTLILNVNTQRTGFVNFETGTSFYSRCKTPYDPSPKIVFRNARYDYPSGANNTMAAWGIDGIDLIGESPNGSFPKTYAQTTLNPVLSNIRYFGVNLYLSQAATTYTGIFYTNGYKAGEFYANTVNENSPVIYVPSGLFTFGGDIRANIYKVKNPTFPVGSWSGAISFSSVTTGYSFSLSYTFNSILLDGQTPVNGMTVRYKPSYLSGSGTQPPYTNLSAITNASGTFTQLELIDAYGVDFTGVSQSGAATTLTRVQWEAKARSYDFKTPAETIFSGRSLYQTGTNMASGYTEKALAAPVNSLTLTQAQAAALMGILLVASGTTGGTITLTSNRTASEVWAYYRNWISTLANFNSEDTWEFDGTTLTTGGWTVAGLEFLTAGQITAGTATAGAAFTASVIGNVTQATPTALTGGSITGELTYNTNTPITVTITGCTVTGTISNSGSALVTVILAGGTTVGTVGSNVVTKRFAPVTAPNLQAGSTVILINTSTGAIIDQQILSTAGYTFNFDWTANIGVTLRHAKIGYIPKISNGVLTSSGLSFLDVQSADVVYNTNGIDGSTVTEFTADYPHIQIDLSDADGATNFQRMYNWFRYIETSYDGLLYFVDGLTATDEFNYLIDTSVIDLKIQNVLTAPVVITGGNMTRSDGTTIIAADSGSIQIQPGKAYLANSASIANSLTAIQTGVNISKVNGFTITGAGTEEYPWGPVV